MDDTDTLVSTTTPAHPANPTTPAFSDPLEWRMAYLEIHTLSEPSRRYAYYLWALVLVIFISMAIVNATGLKGGYLGAWYSKWALRRRTWRGWRYGLFIGRRHPVCLPSNGQLLGTAILLLGTLLLSFVGPDYIPSRTADQSQSLFSRLLHDLDYYEQLRPQYVIQKAWWTVGGRTGLIAFALFPLCILFALKAPPFAVFAIPGLAQIHFDKLAWFHRWSGRLIWFMTTIHIATWLVQLSRDVSDEKGTRVILSAWGYNRFRYGWVGYIALTLTIILSTSPMRQFAYELFYLLHVLLVPLAIVGAALHHPPVWWWCWVALAVWAGERIWRATWWFYINNGFGGVQKPPSHSKDDSESGKRLMGGKESWEMTPVKSSYDLPSPVSAPAIPFQYHPSSALSYIPPIGYAHCELLSGRTVRVTLISPGFFAWAPGQYFLLNIPSVSKLTSHPFTCASICDDESALDSARALVFLVRAKKGWTKDLWDLVVNLSSHYETQPHFEKTSEGIKLPSHGVLLRGFVDGPFGSSVRERWGDNSTVLLIAGGSGVSFTMAVLEYVCACMAGRDASRLGGRTSILGKTPFKTTRVRFVWLVREFSHIQWGASILRRCIAMVSRQSLQVEIFVTNFQSLPPRYTSSPFMFHEPLPLDKKTESKEDDNDNLLVPPNPSYARGRGYGPSSGSRSSSVGSATSDLSTDDLESNSVATYSYGDEEADVSELGIRENYVIDLTNFDGDDDAALPGEDALTRRVIKAGKVQRARARKAEKMGRRGVAGSVDLGVWTSSEHDFSAIGIRHGDEARSSSSSASNSPPKSPLMGTKRPPPSRPISRDSNFFNSRPNSFLAEHADRGGSPLPHSKRDSAADMASIRSLMPQLGRGSGGEQIRLEVVDREMRDINVVSEHARPGKPKLDRILAEEVERAAGSIIAGCCGPASLNAIVRKAVAKQINPDRVRKGDMRGSITLVSEEFAY